MITQVDLFTAQQQPIEQPIIHDNRAELVTEKHSLTHFLSFCVLYQIFS